MTDEQITNDVALAVVVVADALLNFLIDFYTFPFVLLSEALGDHDD